MQLLNKKKLKKKPASHLDIATYVFSIGLCAILGYIFGGVTLLSIGSLLGLGFGFLIEEYKNKLFKS